MSKVQCHPSGSDSTEAILSIFGGLAYERARSSKQRIQGPLASVLVRRCLLPWRLSGRGGSLRTLVSRLVRKNPAHTALRIAAIALIARHQVPVQMRNGLPGRCAVVEADVISIGMQLRVEHALRLIHEFKHRQALFLRR